MPAIAQPSFTSGEWAPSLYGRVDLARFYTALKTCRNFIVRPYGGVMNRPGTEFCIEVKDSTKRVRLIEFIFSSTQAYVLEVGEGYIRFHVNGGIIMDEDVPLEIETPYTEDDLAVLKYVQSADVLTLCHPDHKQRQLSRFSHTSWTLTEYANTEGPFLDINVDEAKTIIASAAVGEAITLTANFDIFTEETVGQMLYLEQSPDDNTKKWEVQKGVAINAIRRRGVNYYQAKTAGTTGTVPPSITDGQEHDGDPGVRWEYLHSGFGIARITEYTDARHVTAKVIKRIPDQITESGSAKAVTDVVTGTPAVEPSGEDPGSAVVYAKARINGHGFPDGSEIVIVGVVGAVEANGTWVIEVIDPNWVYLVGLVLTSAYISDGTAAKATEAVPSYKWAFEAWGGGQGYPATTAYYQQRQVFGGSTGQPHSVWMSTSGGFTSFARSNPLLDDDGIVFKLASRRMNEVRHFVGLRELIALTSEGAWVIKKEQGNPIPIVDFQGRGGAAHVPPVIVGQRALFVLEKGSSIRSLGYFFESDAYEGKDLTMTGSHLLFGRSVVEWAYQETPFSTVWMVLDDGSLLGLTYLPDQDVIGWHRHDTDGAFESVCCIPEGREDSVYVVVRREINGVAKRYVERFRSRFFTAIEDAFFVDSGLTYDGREAGAGVDYTLTGGVAWGYDETLTFTTEDEFFAGVSDVGDALVVFEAASGEALRLQIVEFVSETVVKVLANRTVPEEFRGVERTGFQVARDTFTGLDHLEGKTVSILADGNVEAQKVVVDGGFTLENPSVVVHVGLPITADFETLDIGVQGQSIQDKVKNVRSVTLVVEKTRGLMAGPDADNLLEFPIPMSGRYDAPIAESTGPVKANIKSAWSDGGRVFVRQSDPLPATILAAIPEVVVGGA